ncbi:MAG TPA: hypothetical protein VHA37_06005, partial [Candidatus Saccharimonadales bacterium]|nr:hypothetical protein [Candidatus Saccharimonadales bacterium]
AIANIPPVHTETAMPAAPSKSSSYALVPSLPRPGTKLNISVRTQQLTENKKTIQKMNPANLE